MIATLATRAGEADQALWDLLLGLLAVALAAYGLLILVGYVRERLHERWAGKVCALIDGELGPEETTQVRDHLWDCRRCQRFLLDLAQLDIVLRERAGHE